jgi:hypothetical protein
MENQQNQITKSKKEIIRIIAILIIVTTIVKYIEFLFIRTDQTIIADNVITKIFCIIATLVAMKICGLKLSDVGLKNKNTFKKWADYPHAGKEHQRNHRTGTS